MLANNVSQLRIVGRPGVWPKLQEILEDRFEDWLAEFVARLAKEARYVLTRSTGERVHYISMDEAPKSNYDLIISIRNAPEFADELVWDIEKVVLRSDNKLRNLTPGEREILDFLAPYLRK